MCVLKKTILIHVDKAFKFLNNMILDTTETVGAFFLAHPIVPVKNT